MNPGLLLRLRQSPTAGARVPTCEVLRLEVLRRQEVARPGLAALRVSFRLARSAVLSVGV